MTSTIATDAAAANATELQFVGDPDRIALLTPLGNEMYDFTAVSDNHLDPGRTVVLVPRVPAGGDFTQTTDEVLDADLGGALRELLTAVQAVLPSFADRRGHLIILLPAEPTLGQVGSAVPGAFCGAALSLARTLALELARDHITVNTVLHGEPSPAIRAGLAAQLVALAGSDAATGQEIYIADGTDLGRLRP
jgi:NAD(P)-dependent dehydrogenase (short-subunit alcohol dehydrogenase family)